DYPLSDAAVLHIPGMRSCGGSGASGCGGRCGEAGSFSLYKIKKIKGVSPMEYSITTGTSKGKTRYQYIDVLNILACLCVVFMHCNGIVHSYENTRAWKESMIVETVAYWAVPVFFMISGATLLGYRDKYSTTVFLKKRMVKTVIPFVIWTVINIVFKTVTGLMEPDFSVSGIISMFN